MGISVPALVVAALLSIGAIMASIFSPGGTILSGFGGFTIPPSLVYLADVAVLVVLLVLVLPVIFSAAVVFRQVVGG